MTNLRQIILPLLDNDGFSLAAEHEAFEAFLLAACGGFTVLDVRGAWKDDSGRVFRDHSKAYQVACDPTRWDGIVQTALDVFHDQHAIFHATLGVAHIEARPARVATA